MRKDSYFLPVLSLPHSLTALCTHLPDVSDVDAFSLFVHLIFEFLASYPTKVSHMAKKLASHIALPPLLAAGLPDLPNARRPPQR